MRTTKGAARNQAKKRLRKRTKGYVGGRGSLLRSMKETVLRAGAYAFRDRRTRKRNFRRLWIIRINAAARERGLRYSEFVHGLGKAKIELNRKMLAELAVTDPSAFDAITEEVKAALAA
ncbi:MAG TPA: 50S ribosomal protein L20 [Planctomycetaceae bacterium]|nr:50S ribosomal protein L20 [Blastopirellula sp.]HAY79216.1 50S ribosomal protein L20 [Planctomycetaceae bacterium]|tara:strand:+ start:140 stop:496 length:357 start_codon:yes stop_codon:yes gene_type:complete